MKMIEAFDFVIVGGGTSGCLLASCLASSHPDLKIALIEAGPDVKSEDFPANTRLFERDLAHLDYGYETTPQINLQSRTLSYAQGKCLGGSSAINRLLWTVGSQDDFDNWAKDVRDTSWIWDNVAKAITEIVNLHDKTPEGFEETGLQRLCAMNGTSAGSLDVSLPPQWIPEMSSLLSVLNKSGVNWNQNTNSGNPLGVGFVWNSYNKKTRSVSSSAFLRDRMYPNLTIFAESSAQSITFETLRASSVELANGHNVTAKKDIILCTGAFNTPALLMRSGIGPEKSFQSAGVRPLVSLPGVGKNLSDHTRVQLLSIVSIPTSATYQLLPGFDSSLIAWLQLPEVLNSSEYRALPHETRNRIAMSKTPTCEFLITVVPNPNDLATKIISIMVINMNPQARGSVSILSRDSSKSLTVDPNLLGHDYDQRVMIEGVRKAMSWLDDIDLAPFKKATIQAPPDYSENEIRAFLRQYADVVWHATGTVAMGCFEDEMTCVDTNFCLRGVEGLRVADLSICPFTPNTHTQSTAYIVGWMAAQKITEEHAVASR